MDLVADIRMMLNDFGVSATLTDVSASTSITVKGIEKAVDYVGHYAPPEKKKGKK